MAFEVSFDASLEPQSELVLVVAGGGQRGESDQPLVVQIDKSGRGHLELSATDEPWRLSCASSAYWCSARLTSGSDQTARLRVFPAGVIQGRPTISTGSGTALPTQIVVQAWASEIEGEGISFDQIVEIEEASFRFKVPAVPLDLRFAFEGWAPAYFWDFEAEAGAETSLGPLRLLKGASLCGFVVEEGTALPLVGAEVSLGVPTPQPGISVNDYARLSRMRWKTMTNERGFFQIAGAAEGEFRLELNQPPLAPAFTASEGSAEEVVPGAVQGTPFVIEPVTLTASAETCLDDIFFPVAHEVIFAVTPAQTPDQDPWKLILIDAHSSASQPVSIETDELGLASVAVQNGEYRVAVLDSSGARVTRQAVSIEGPGEISLDLDLITVRGTLTLGGEPILGEIRFTGAEIDTVFSSDSEGQFGGLMRAPRGRELVAHVKSAYPAFSRWVELGQQEGDDGILTLELDFQDRSIEGVVRDEGGQPLRRVQVVAMQPSGLSARVLSEVDGEFSVDGLEPGTYRVWAELEEYGASESQEVVVSKVELDSGDTGAAVGDVELIIVPGVKHRGRLLDSNGGPVMGARLAISFPGQIGWHESSSTGVDGRFDFRAPPSVNQALVTSAAASVGLLWSTCAQIVEGTELTLQIPPTPGGTLLLKIPEDFKVGSQLVVSTSDGGLMTLGDLGRWARRRGTAESTGSIRVPDVASGFYSAKRVRGAALDFGCRAGLGSDWQQLAPGGELALDGGDAKNALGSPMSAGG